jgi:hypothetical protein
MPKFSRALPWLLAVLVAVWIVLGAAEPTWACPNCKDTLAEHGGRLQIGYALSIGLMIAAPFGILGGWAVAIYRMMKTTA